MPGPRPISIHLTVRQRTILEQSIRRQTSEQRLVRRVSIILLAAEGANHQQIANRQGVNLRTVRTWRARWEAARSHLEAAEAEGVDDSTLTALIKEVLTDVPRPTFTPEQIVQIVAVACEDPADSGHPISHWTPREVTAEVIVRGIVASISPRQVGRFLKEVDLKPHQVRYWQQATPEDPKEFAREVTGICELYQQAPALAAQGDHLVSTDEKTGVQAVERARSSLPMRPGLVERQEFEYIRHGTQCLIANFDVATGQILAPSVGPTRTEADFPVHIAQTVAIDPEGQWVFVVDRLNTHQSESLVRFVANTEQLTEDLGVKGSSGILHSMATRAAFLQEPTHRIRFVYTPTHASWLNQIELWFSILVRRLLRRASFTSIEDLRQRILAFIDYFNKTMAKPFKWTYAGRPLTA